ncbi:ShlB/FhaC/HecB family hemolysin secretion/activation protein [Candidatus Reidiella endopervernicosa]|nr:ShlB/FhaC/HecB family hemolysin secretion/activation protein [Candidatus Reidiella endopervernicosa]QKQ25390.1 ShlB/FhaC/HecB family hemolysin secretion/activation protein [Candidatus Reidiella endopervernicosa]
MPTQAAPPSGTVLPGQIEKQFQTQPQLRQRSEGIERAQELERAPPGAAEIRFSLNAIELEGFSAYPQGELETYLGPLLNREVTLLELYRLANTLTTKYRSDGYTLSQVVVPAQSIEKGVARLQAIEGYISQVRIVGDRYDSRDMVADYAERIRRERPLMRLNATCC